MKFAALAMLFAVVVVVRSDRCRDQEDCEADECCVARAIAGLFRRGDCAKLAIDGEHCSDKEETIGEKYYGHCPCADNLTCEPEEIKDFGRFGKIKINERCTSQPSTASSEAPTTAVPEGTEAPAEE